MYKNTSRKIFSCFQLFSFFLIFFSTNLLFSQNKYDDFAKQAKFEKDNLKKIDIFCKLGFYYTDSTKALSYFDQAELLSKKENTPDLIYLVLAKKAFVSGKFGLRKKQKILNDSVFKQLSKLKRTSNTADIYYVLGISENGTAKGLEYYFKGLEIAEEVQDYSEVAKLSYNISGLYGELTKFDFMKQYVEKAKMFANKAKTFDSRIFSDLASGGYYTGMFQKTENKKYLDSTIQVYSATKIYVEKYKPEIIFTKQLSYVYINLANAYSIDNIRKNKIQFLESLELAEKYGEELNSFTAMNNAIGLRGEYYLSENDFEKAIANFKKGLQLSVSNKSFRLASDFCNSLINCYSKTNDFSNYKKYSELKSKYSSLHFNEETTKEVVAAEEKYESEKKEIRIKTLEKENKLKTYLFWIILGLFITLSVLIILFFRFFKTKENLMNEKQLASELLAKLREKEIQKTLLEKNMMTEQKNKSDQQLMNSLLQIEEKNNLLTAVKNSTDNKSISRIINENLQSDESFERNKKQITDAYPTFFYRLQLKSNHTLTPLDLKYCAYFLTGIETKEIAKKLNIEPKSVRMTRYRIKQKLQLSEQEDLLEFIKSSAI